MSTSAPPSTAQQSLPTPVVDPDDVQALVPGLSDDDAQRCAQLATLALEAVLWPTPIPAPPLPAPMYLATMRCAARLATSGAAPGGAGQVVSESIGTYTYRLATPTSPDVALAFVESELELLEPWLGDSSAYQLNVGEDAVPWPYDFWQRDLDNPLAAADYAPPALVPTPPEPPPVLGVAYTFSTALTGAPAAGVLRLDDPPNETARRLYASDLTADGENIVDKLLTLAQGDVVRVEVDVDNAFEFTVTKLTDRSGHVEYGGTVTALVGSVAADGPVRVTARLP